MSEREQLASLVRDLWQYATGEPWGEMSEERAEAESDTLASLYQRVKAMEEGGAGRHPGRHLSDE